MQLGTAFKLVIEDDDGSRSVVPCELGEVSIGRYEDNTIRLDERNVSRHHARLLKAPEGVFAEDLDSYNGVWVNGERIEGRQEIMAGDVIRIGDFVLELRGEGLKEQREEVTARTPMPGLNEATEPSITQVDIQAPRVNFEEGLTDPEFPLTALQSDTGENVEKTAIIRSEDYPDMSDARDVKVEKIAGLKPKLLVVNTINAGQEIIIDKTTISIGRTDEDNDVALEHRSISRNHAKIAVNNDVYQLQDLESANGVSVNGDPYVQCDLQFGDLVELGHVKLRFITPGQIYAPNEEERLAIAKGKYTGGSGVSPTKDFDLYMRLGQRPVQIGLGLAALLLLIVLGSFIMMDTGPIKSEKNEDNVITLTPKKDSSKSNTVPKVSWLHKGQEALGNASWAKALAYANMALSEGESADEAEFIIETANKEKKISQGYDGALQAVESGQWEEAWKALKAIPDDSYYSPQASALREQIKQTLVEDLAKKATQNLANKDWNKARSIAEEINRLDPENMFSKKIYASIEQEKNRRESAAAKVKSMQSNATKKKRSVLPDIKSTPSAAELRNVAKTHYEEGSRLMATKRHQDALRRFGACIKADKTFYPCYIGLGNSHGSLNNHEKTARYYKLYVKYAPDGASKDQVVQWLQNYESR